MARRMAVIGSGVAGLTAAYVLQRECDVTLFEAGDRAGGHARTHDVVDDGRVLAVDSGFLVHNDRAFPRLVRLLRELGVRTREADTSMAVRCRGCGLEYAGGSGPAGWFARPANALQPGFLGLLAQLPRFHRLARRHVRYGSDRESLGGFLKRARFSRYFADHFAVPLVCAVRSCAPGRVLDYPARYLFAFLDHLGALPLSSPASGWAGWRTAAGRRTVSGAAGWRTVSGAAGWRTVEGGSRSYVDLITKRLHSVRTGDPVRSVRRHPDGVTVHDSLGSPTEYDGVVVATHADQALRLLADSTERERRILGAIRYERTVGVLHTDSSVLSRRSRTRASCNHVRPSCRSGPGAAPHESGAGASGGGAWVSYDLNRVQRLDATRRYVLTLNDPGTIDPDSVIERMACERPLFTAESGAAQRLLPSLNEGRTAFAGAYHGWGLQEDSCQSGAAAAASLGVRW